MNRIAKKRNLIDEVMRATKNPMPAHPMLWLYEHTVDAAIIFAATSMVTVLTRPTQAARSAIEAALEAATTMEPVHDSRRQESLKEGKT